MISINEVRLMGVVGKVETREAGSARVTNISLATTSGGYKSKGGKDIPEVTQWHNVKVWSNKFIEDNVRKGNRLYVTGSIDYRQYDGNDGQKRFMTEIKAEQVVLLDRPQKGGEQEMDEETARKIKALAEKFA